LAVLVFLPVLPLDGRHLPYGGNGDPMEMSWFLGWTAHALVHHLNPFFTNAIDHPAGVNLMANTSVPALGVVAAPVTVFLGPVRALNLMFHVAFAASATSMFLVLRRWTTWWPAAFAGGLLYGFGPYMASQADGNAHLHLAFVAVFPLILVCFDDLFVSRQHDPRLMGALLGLLAAAQLLISTEMLALAAFLTSLGLLALAATHPRELRQRLRTATAGITTAVATFGVIGAYPIWVFFRGARHTVGPVQPVATLHSFHADLLSPFVPTTHQRVAPGGLTHVANHFFGGNLSENGAYLGVPLIVLVVGFAIARRRVGLVRLASFLALCAFVMSLGSRLTIDEHRLPIPLPFAIAAHIPLLESVVPGRFAVFVGLFVAVILAVGLDRAHGASQRDAADTAGNGANRRRHGANMAISLLTVLALVTLIPGPFRSRSLDWPPDFVSALKRSVPKGGVVLTYPYPAPPHDEAMVWQAIDQMHFRLVGGYAYVPGPGGTMQYYPPLEDPPAVQEIFGQAAVGGALLYPPPPTLDESSYGQLRTFIKKHSVDAVAIWTGTGADPTLAERYVSGALGPPAARFHHAEIWFIRRARS
jgi:hypothetical protein